MSPLVFKYATGTSNPTLIGGTIPSTILPVAVGQYRHGETFWSIPSRLSAERMKAGPHVREERVPPRAADRRLWSFRMVN